MMGIAVMCRLLTMLLRRAYVKLLVFDKSEAWRVEKKGERSPMATTGEPDQFALRDVAPYHKIRSLQCPCTGL